MPDPFDPFANSHGGPEVLKAGDPSIRVEDLIYANGEFRVLLRVDHHDGGTVTLKWLDLLQGVFAGTVTLNSEVGVYIRRKMPREKIPSPERVQFEASAGTNALPQSLRDDLWHQWMGTVDNMQVDPEHWYKTLSRLVLRSFKEGVRTAMADEQAAEAWAADD